MLLALKKQLSPTDYAKKLDVVRKYNKLKTYNKRENVENWLKDWETTYTDGKKLQIPDVSDERSLIDFTTAIASIDSGYASTQDYFLTQRIKKNENLPELYELVEDFRNHLRKTNASKLSSSHSAFATLRGENQDGETQDGGTKDGGIKEGSTKDDRKVCLCGLKHKDSKWQNCHYITPKCRPTGWKGKPETFDKINDAISKWKKEQRHWFIRKFKYDGLEKGSRKTSKKNKDQKDSDSEDSDSEDSDSDDDSDNSRSRSKSRSKSNKTAASLVVYSALGSSKDRKRLYNSWTLDNASDIHVCNDENRSEFKKTRDALPGDEIVGGKTSYPIEAFGTVKINVQTPKGQQNIELSDVALAPGFMSNLVSLAVINTKGAHWNSEKPNYIKRNGKILCYLEKVGLHWVLEKESTCGSVNSSMSAKRSAKASERTAKLSANSFANAKSNTKRKAKFTSAQMHRVLGHASPEVISHVEDAMADITIDNSSPAPSTIECETCSLSKATEIVSRRTEVDEPENGIPFDRTTWDLVGFTRGYNRDQYMSHFQCRQYLFNLVFTHPQKNDALQIFEKAINLIENQYGGKVRFIRLDGETSLGKEFENLVSAKGIKPECTAPDTLAQNGGSERSGRVLVTKGRTMRIEAKLPANLWPETLKGAGYIENRTPIRKLGWKTPYEAVLKRKPRGAHMHVYGTRAYALDHHIPRKNKLDPRAYIGHLVGYDSTNIYRIWIPSRMKVIRTRDVTFNNNLLYDPTSLDIGAVLKEEMDRLIETIDLPEIQENPTVDRTDIFDLLDTTEVSNLLELEEPCGQQLQLPNPSPSIKPVGHPQMSESYLQMSESHSLTSVNH